MWYRDIPSRCTLTAQVGKVLTGGNEGLENSCPTPIPPEGREPGSWAGRATKSAPPVDAAPASELHSWAVSLAPEGQREYWKNNTTMKK